MTTVTLERYEAFVPTATVTVEELADRLGLTRLNVRVFRRLHGLDRIAYDPSLDLFEMVLEPARRLLTALANPDEVRFVIYTHSSAAVTPFKYDAAKVIRESLGLRRAEAFAVTQQNCASALAAIDVAGLLLRQEPDPRTKALVVAGEKVFTPALQLLPGTGVMGEAAGCCLVAVDGTGDKVISYVAHTHGEYAGGVWQTVSMEQRFRSRYAEMLTDVIKAATAEAGIAPSDIDLIVPHNINLWSWKQTSRRLGLEWEKVFSDNIPRYGHCFTADVFVNYVSLRESGRLRPGAYYLLVSVGLGATFGAMVIRRAEGGST